MWAVRCVETLIIIHKYIDVLLTEDLDFHRQGCEINFATLGSSERLLVSFVLHTLKAKLLQGPDALWQHLVISSVQRVANINIPSRENRGSQSHAVN
jgi:hypothetical protein